MELPSASLATAGATLLPIAYYAVQGWFNRPRNVRNVKKNVICLPSKSGKTSLAKSLVSNKNMMLIDLDEFIKTVNEPELLDKIDDAKANNNTGLYSILYGSAADKALDFVKTEIKKDPKLRCIFLTSDFDWSVKRFKSDQIYVAIPSQNLHKSILEAAPKEEREAIASHRLDFIQRLPFESVKTYNS